MPFQLPNLPNLGSLSADMITGADLIRAVAVLAFAVAMAILAHAGLQRLRDQIGAGRSALYLMQRASTIVILLAGFIAALAALGIELTHISLFIGALGVGVGLGFQQAVRNFLAGLTLLSDRSIAIGDFIELESGTQGEVHEVGARATRIVTNDNVHVLVPNSWLVEARVINWTRGRQTRRIHVPFLAPFGVDKELVRKAVLEAAHSVPFTLPDEENRKTQVWLVGFAEQGLKFELVVWPTPDAVKRPAAMNAAYTWAIDDALRRNGLSIPLPQLDVRFPDGAPAVAQRPEAFTPLPRRAPVVTPPQPSPADANDAAEDVNRPQPPAEEDQAEAERKARR